MKLGFAIPAGVDWPSGVAGFSWRAGLPVVLQSNNTVPGRSENISCFGCHDWLASSIFPSPSALG